MTWILSFDQRSRFVLACCVLLVAGCGTSGPDFPHATLSGSVTLDGTPVDGGRVNFMPAAGATGAPTSAEINEGRFVADAVPLGNVTVTFAITQATGKMIAEGDREPYPETVSVVPPQYAAGIPLTVTGDNVAQDFTLVNE